LDRGIDDLGAARAPGALLRLIRAEQLRHGLVVALQERDGIHGSCHQWYQREFSPELNAKPATHTIANTTARIHSQWIANPRPPRSNAISNTRSTTPIVLPPEYSNTDCLYVVLTAVPETHPRETQMTRRARC